MKKESIPRIIPTGLGNPITLYPDGQKMQVGQEHTPPAD